MIKSLILSIALFGLPVALHPIHVSVTEINFDEKDKALEIMMRVFMDDLEATMRTNLNKPDLDILNPQGITLDEMMSKYISESFVVALEGKRQKLNYLGHEKEGEAFIFYIEIEKVRKWKQMSVSNTVLTEAFEDQSNLVHVSAAGTVKSLRLNKDHPSGNLSF